MINFLRPLETSSALGLFARDTGGCLLSRVSLSRTKEERKEVSFSEISESLIFYFLAPFLNKTFSKLFSKLKNPEIAKTAQIISIFGIVLPIIYLIPFVRNNITKSDSGKDEFISVIGLKNEQNDKKEENTKKNKDDLFKKASVVSISSLLASLSLILFSKNKDNYKKIEPLIKKFNEIFKTDDGLKLIHYGALIYPVSILGYLKASRDKYEKQENIRRFSVSVPLLLAGDKLIEKPIYKFFDKEFNTSVLDKNQIKTYDEILKIKDNKQMLKTKNWAFGLNYFVSTILVAAGIMILNRIKTKKNYEKESNLNKNK